MSRPRDLLVYAGTVTLGLLIVALVMFLYVLILVIFGPGNAAAEPGPSTVIVVLHPGGGTSDSMRDKLGWGDTLAGIPVLYPQGEGREWRSGWAGSTATRDDLAYLETLTAGWDRVIVVGQSQGGMMALTWACHDPRVAGVTVTAALLPVGVSCPTSPVRAVIYAGALDRVIPPAGDEMVYSLADTARRLGGRVRVTFEAFDGATVTRGGGVETRTYPTRAHIGLPPRFAHRTARWLTNLGGTP